jgi:hypothetical protein
MISKRRFSAHTVAILAILALSGIVIAQGDPARDSGAAIVITEIRADSTCSNHRVSVYAFNADSGYLEIGVSSEGRFITDNIVGAWYPAGVSAFSSSGYHNDRGLAPVNYWPLAPSDNVIWDMRLYGADLEPRYRATAKAKTCGDVSFKKTSHGPAHQLLRNHSFEADGLTAGVTDPEQPAFWIRKNANNDSRVCDPPRAGSSTYIGECGFLFIAEDGFVTKLKQTYTGSIGKQGDLIELGTFIQSFAGYSGGGKVKAKLTFADGTSNTLMIQIAAGEHLYGTFPDAYPHRDRLKLPAALTSAKVTIMQKNGLGNVAVDGVTLTVYTSEGVAPRALPLPDAPGAESIDLQQGG